MPAAISYCTLCSDMVTQLLESMGDDLDLKMDEYCSMLMSAEGDSRCVFYISQLNLQESSD